MNQFYRQSEKWAAVMILILITAPLIYAQPGGRYIVVDQFGYPPDAKKIAVIRDPQVGFDAAETYLPGTIFSVVEASSGDAIFSGVANPWQNGITDESSGDRIWHFDFSAVTDPGTYYILDEEKGQRSYTFRIAHNVYNEVLKHAVRTFFYQRVGFEKKAEFAGVEWADDASHIGDLQDLNCRSFFAQQDASSERNVSGGWYDAGDYNKYTSWTANYVVDFMKAYLENPEAFGDDYGLPESGNGIPDLLDEAKWGIDHLLRLQLENGSVLSIVGEASASPPSAATGPSFYGKVNTSGTLNVAAALALSSLVYRMIGQTVYADTLLARATSAWDWAEMNPDVLFNNNDPDYGSAGLGAGRMEVDDYTRNMLRLEAACFLFDATGTTKYRDYFDANYTECHMMQWTFAFPYELTNQEALLYYTSIQDGTTAVQENIKNTYRTAMLSNDPNFKAYDGVRDPYFAFLDSYTWGSNRTKSAHGMMYADLVHYNINPSTDQKAMDAALGYVNYLHGVNPLTLVYLSNMYEYGAENAVNEFYHSWFTDGSEKWDRVGVSEFGPPPGFLTGGPNPYYDWDGCCPSGCGSSSNNSMCQSESLFPPKNQPRQKSYKDFNTSWPLNSWSVTENSCGYQIMYIRLLSQFVNAKIDCNGDLDGTAFFDSCGVCAGGNTGLTPILDPGICAPAEDCNGDPGGTAFPDSCGICSGGASGREPVLQKEACYDCNGDFNGTAILDSCGLCAGGATGIDPVLEKEACYDCNSDFNGTAVIDSCGLCSGGATGIDPVLEKDVCYDCNGDFNGTAVIDSCGLCSGGATGVDPVLQKEACYDCNGDFNGNAFIDSCGICAEGNTGVASVLDPDECQTGNGEYSTSVRGAARIFPNPANGKVYIQFPGQEVDMLFVDIGGRIVLQDSFSNEIEVDISGLGKGIYEVVLYSKSHVSRHKLVIL